MKNIKNRNLQHNFLVLFVISVKSEQIGKIGANLVKLSKKEHFVKPFYMYLIQVYIKPLE